MSKKLKFHTVYQEKNGQRVDIPALKGSGGSGYDDTEIRQEIGRLSEDKVDKPDDPPTAIGKVLKVKAINEDGTFVCEWADGGTDGVTDVLVDGKSVVDDGVARVPGADTSNRGTVLYANDSAITSRTNLRAIPTNRLNYAVTAALTDDKHIVLNAEQQQTAQEVLGILSVEGVTF